MKGSKSVVILAHGFTNDRSSNGRFDEIVSVLNKEGIDTLAFDFSGCGESDDDAITIEHQVEDLNAVIEYVLSKGYKEIVLFGNSFGTVACLMNGRPEIKTMILVGALTNKMFYDWSLYFSKEQLFELETKGFFHLDDPRKHLITSQTLKDYESLDSCQLANQVSCPVLIIHGNHIEDEEEIALLSHSKAFMKKLPEGSKLEIIEGGRHGLRQNWHHVIDFTCRWLEGFV